MAKRELMLSRMGRMQPETDVAKRASRRDEGVEVERAATAAAAAEAGGGMHAGAHLREEDIGEDEAAEGAAAAEKAAVEAAAAEKAAAEAAAAEAAAEKAAAEAAAEEARLAAEAKKAAAEKAAAEKAGAAPETVPTPEHVTEVTPRPPAPRPGLCTTPRPGPSVARDKRGPAEPVCERLYAATCPYLR